MDESESRGVTSTTTFSFNYKSVREHISCVLSQPRSILVTFFAVFTAFWSLYEATIASFALTPNRLLPYLAFLFVSVSAGIGVRVYQYVTDVPEGLEGVNKHAQRIANLRPLRWEFRFAMSVLAEKLSPIDDECRELLAGNVFVHAVRPVDLKSYLAFLEDHPKNLMRLVGVANRVMINEFPSSLRSTEEKPASATNILSQVELIARLYGETVKMERMSHSVLPPPGFERLQSLQLGWAQPIRDAIQQLFQFLQGICDVDCQTDSSLQYKIEFDVPSTVDEYCEELARLEEQLPQLLENDL